MDCSLQTYVQLEVQTFTRSEAIPGDQTCAEFPVLVQVTAPPWPVGEHIPRTGVDIVAVLDIDKMVLDEPKRNLLKQAMTMVIDKLGPSDRFSVVSFEAHLSFNDKTPRILELTSMSNQGRYFARQMVNKLSWSHGTSMVAGLEMGAEVRPHVLNRFQILHIFFYQAVTGRLYKKL
jgi:hypothetical protein